ncbi:hypothetical protein Pst134EA_026892 [Puccinia striiformis f. sp. tritici]|uniref:hypothetical protein n=1 Tax=Puccinia striiformis f. sp. tritici TaxID=168172 RepID=UPI002007C6AD|nr:hypothetical protein Pst134EA_026892 [Puccinia striiformis f. sp. tritici]KAH9450183.1 hypothetical protein Pst134EA_026892 [Puccinia striiformis f. sp. tritici]KAI9626611.1 hypothetical protein KEM48_010278 [Puccinia striiformis f. sp. tritici PST-130]
MENQPLDILSELASSAAAQEQQQEQEPISDQAFQALLLASLNEPTASTNQQLHFITQHQHAQDLLSALSALQTEPSSSLTQIEPFQPSQQQQQSQDELDFDDPNLFSPFDPGHHHHLQQDPVSLTDQIDLLFGSSQPSTSSARKVYSNSFSFQQQQQQSEHQQEQDLSQLDNQLDLYHHLPLDDHHEFNFLFNPDYHQQQPIPPPDQSNSEFNPEDTYNQINGLDDDLLDRLDNGLIDNSNQEEFKLNELDSKIENSIELNQSYSNHIKATLDHLNTLHDKAQKFLSISKHCLSEIQQQQKSSSFASTSKHTLPSLPHQQGSKHSTLISDQIAPISLPWFKHKFGVDLPHFKDGKRRDQYNSLLHSQPWQPPERRKLDEEVANILKTNNQNKSEIDWERVAQNFPERKPIECKIQWTQKQDPSLNKSKWTLPEIDRLFEIVKKFDHKNWDLISNELATGRTASECVKQFRIVTQEKREWSEQDDLLLKEGVSTYGQNWQAVANHCGRSSNQCINRWSKTLRPDIKKGKWDPIEDEALKSAVAACGMVWKDVAPRVRGRTDAQCRERWCNILDPRIVVGNWTPEEDQKILRMRDVERKTWSEISKSFNGRRTDNHCMRRHSELKRVKDPTLKRHSGSHPKTVGPLLLITNGGGMSSSSSNSSVGGGEGERQSSTERVMNNNSLVLIGTTTNRPNTTLGRVLIPSNSGYTRRNNPHHHHHPNLSSSSSTANNSSKIPIIIDHESSPVVSPSDHSPIDSSSDLTPTTPLIIHHPTPTPPPPEPDPPPPPVTSTATTVSQTTTVTNNSPLSRAPNSRLRIVNKRIKYST